MPSPGHVFEPGPEPGIRPLRQEGQVAPQPRVVFPGPAGLPGPGRRGPAAERSRRPRGGRSGSSAGTRSGRLRSRRSTRRPAGPARLRARGRSGPSGWRWRRRGGGTPSWSKRRSRSQGKASHWPQWSRERSRAQSRMAQGPHWFSRRQPGARVGQALLVGCIPLGHDAEMVEGLVLVGEPEAAGAAVQPAVGDEFMGHRRSWIGMVLKATCRPAHRGAGLPRVGGFGPTGWRDGGGSYGIVLS